MIPLYVFCLIVGGGLLLFSLLGGIHHGDAELDAYADAELHAEGEAAQIREKGLAQVGVFQALLTQMTEGGEGALRVYLAEKLPDLFQRAADSLDQVTIDRLVVLDREGEGVSRVANQKPAAILGMIEQVAGGLGLDLEQVMRRTDAQAQTKSPRVEISVEADNGRALPRGDGAGSESQ